MIFYHSAQRYERFRLLHKVTRTKLTIINICSIVLMILPLVLRLYFMNYDPVLRSYNCILHDKIVLFMQRNLHLFVEKSQCYHTYMVVFSVVSKLVCNRPYIPHLQITSLILNSVPSLSCGTTWHAAGMLGSLKSTATETEMARYGQQFYMQLEEDGYPTGYRPAIRQLDVNEWYRVPTAQRKQGKCPNYSLSEKKQGISTFC